MSKGKRDQEPASPGDELLRKGAEAELRLLGQERRAESRLSKAVSAMEKDRSRLDKAQNRLERSQKGVKVAKLALRDAQERRSFGPDASD
jgi:hypothetical protein